MVGHTWGHFRILRSLGSGCCGDVFHAEDLRRGRHVALKLLQPSACHNLHSLEDLKRAAEMIASLQHENIRTVEEIDEYDGRYFLVMELLDGQTLADMPARTPADLSLILEVGTQAAAALAAAHALGVVHGNVKPSNIFVTNRGRVKLLDFCLTRPFAKAHTQQRREPERDLPYTSPEEFLNQGLDARSDIFSLGVVLYELATGQMPFTGRAPHHVVDAILHREPVRAGRLNPLLPSGVEWAVHRALEKDRTLRYQTAEDLRADLDRVLHASHAHQH